MVFYVAKQIPFTYQDIGNVIESVELSDGDWIVTREDIEKLFEGTYPINCEAELFHPAHLDLNSWLFPPTFRSQLELTL